MKNDISKKARLLQQKKVKLMLAVLMYILSTVVFIARFFSGSNNIKGSQNISYSPLYVVIIAGAYILATTMLLPLIKAADRDKELTVRLLPLMVFSAIGMMKLDSYIFRFAHEADFSPLYMFLIFIGAIILITYTGYTLIGVPAIILGSAIFPAFGLSFAPFIAAVSVIADNKSKKNMSIVSVIANGVTALAAAVLTIVRCEAASFSFSKKYVPVIILSLALIVFFAIKKEYKLMITGILPLFPLAAGIFFSAFPTAIFTMTAACSPTVILLGSVVLCDRNEKIKGYAQTLVHNPFVYIVTAAFILRTASPSFLIPGESRNMYY